MTDKPFPVVYKLESGPEDCPSFIAFLARYVSVLVDRKPTGEVRIDFLPVRFSGSGREVAEAKAKAFWDDEIARKQAKEEQGKKLAAGKRLTKAVA